MASACLGVFEKPPELTAPLDADTIFCSHEYLHPPMLEQLRKVSPNKCFGPVTATCCQRTDGTDFSAREFVIGQGVIA